MSCYSFEVKSILDYSVEVDEAEDEKKEDRKANLNSARVFLYQGIRRFFSPTNHGVSLKRRGGVQQEHEDVHRLH